MEANWIHLQFTDLLGVFRQVIVTKEHLKPEVFEDGISKLDGSSVYGFKPIENSDLVLKPLKETEAIIPWAEEPSIRYITQVYEPGGKRLPTDPRFISERLEEYLESQGLKAFAGSEIEFFIVNEFYLDMTPDAMGFEIVSDESIENASTGIPEKAGYYLTGPQDTVRQVRNEILATLKEMGITSTVHHHEVASFGQSEINIRHYEPAKAADAIVTAKYVIRNVSAINGLTAVLMPKVFYNDNGSGMHIHMSLWSGDKNLFYDPSNPGGISETARYFIGGVIEHLEAVATFTNPTVNSYRRLVPGYEAPVYGVWGVSNRSAMIRVPRPPKPDEKFLRLEFRQPDPTANPYLAIAALIMAGLDGVKKKIDPGDQFKGNVYHLTEAERRGMGIKTMPPSLAHAIDSLESDNDFLKPVFPDELIETYIDLKWAEFKELQKYPSPAEFAKYFNL
ncbi:MAG: type I glutamate--ammonia ligase [Desulfurococcales archaeon]|nr:type I glutamate--ammonia ligase [Desulfurococcales archaeon]